MSFYDREYGDLTDVGTTDTFDASVQLVRDRLPPDADYEVDATWTHGLGDMEVRTPHGTVVAHVEAVNGGNVTVQPRVIFACSDDATKRSHWRAFLNSTAARSGSHTCCR